MDLHGLMSTPSYLM